MLLDLVQLVVSIPFYAVGWVIGYISRPFVNGFTDGFNITFKSEAQRVLSAAQKRIEKQYE